MKFFISISIFVFFIYTNFSYDDTMLRCYTKVWVTYVFFHNCGFIVFFFFNLFKCSTRLYSYRNEWIIHKIIQLSVIRQFVKICLDKIVFSIACTTQQYYILNQYASMFIFINTHQMLKAPSFKCPLQVCSDFSVSFNIACVDVSDWLLAKCWSNTYTWCVPLRCDRGIPLVYENA